jgi:hypothetical protein
MADIVLISPRFEPSYWGVDYAMPRKSFTMPSTRREMRPRKSGSQRTHWWRERVSNPRSPVRGTTLSRLPPSDHSGNSPSATATGSFATGTDGSNRSPSASESVVNERQIEFGEMRRGEFDRLPVQDVGGAGDSRSRPTGSRNTHASAVFSSIGPHCCSNSAL